ncbi:MAG: prepilin-type N-terminal cleavage/methylation domain-containing protein [Rhodoferax sp.]
MCTTERRQRGFTLIELIIFIVIVGIGVTGILSVYTNTIRNSADPMVRKQAMAIAESLMEEITAKEYANPTGGYTGVTRSLWDDVDDYNGYTSATVVDLQGSTVAGLTGYRIAPAVSVATTTLGAATVKKIIVNVTDTQNNVVTLTGYRGNY